MELRGASVLLLGGSGLVGMAVARRLLEHAPARLLISGLTRAEAEAGADELRREAAGVTVEARWGNIFLPVDLADRPRSALIADASSRRRLVEELLGPASGPALEKNLLYHWLTTDRPDAVVDCVNTATALAYQDQFASASGLLAAADDGRVNAEHIERHLLTLAMPQLIRHLQTMTEGFRRGGTQAYVKIGTSGTGGMGLNIPYTHSEERPSRTLMTKSAVAGAQSMFLFLLGRTPGAPAIIEIKPAAAIAWREVAYGPIRRGGAELELVDCERPIPLDRAFAPDATGWTRLGRPLESVFINVGENGVFARDEFETVSSIGQMEFVTPEEIAEAVVSELRGRPTGKDIVAALDGAVFGPTYRAGFLRQTAVEKLRALESEHGVRSVAFEMLGPPRLTKLLYEAFLLGRCYPSVVALAAANAEAAARAAAKHLAETEPQLRRQILSVGLPIVLPDGKSILRGPTVVVPPDRPGADVASRGWVDLRPASIGQWIRRAGEMAAATRDERTGSFADLTAMRPEAPIEPARMAVWVFEHEDGGFRVKR